MNLLVSYNWLKSHAKLDASPQDFANRISLSGPSVERIIEVGKDLDKVVVGRIVEVKPHPDADKLRVVLTDIGGEEKDIVCGGSNLEAGQHVVVALPGAMVRWHGEGEPVEIKAAKLRGVESYGMICGANEVGLEDMFPAADEKEIVDLGDLKVKPGTPIAEALELEDTVFDVEVTTNRPDAFGMVGMAREAAAIMEKPFIWKADKAPGKPKREKLPLKVKVEAKDLCPRYQAVVMKNVKVGPSPLWLKRRLAAAGLNSINNVVDITNYILLDLAQPMHAFDYETLKGHAIVVREAKKGEKMMTLKDEEKTLKPGQLVIADAERPVAVAGVMGGKETGVTEKTTTIVFEGAAFEPVQVRRTSRALNLQSDSQLRYEKGLSTEATAPAIAMAVRLAEELCGAEVASEVFDVRASKYAPLVFPFRPARAEELIGVAVKDKEMKRILTDLGFKVSGSGKGWKVEVPYWRDHDIEGERDLVEEVARVYGYGNLPSVLPEGRLPDAPHDPSLEREDALKRTLKDWGYTEFMTYSFVSEDLMGKEGLDPASALKVLNPLSEDLSHMRTSLVASVLAAVERNQEEAAEGSAFEMANVYLPRKGELPEERLRLAVADWGRKEDGSQVRRTKGALESLMGRLGLSDGLTFSTDGLGAIWHPGRSAVVRHDDTPIGTVGEVHPAVLARFGIDRRVALADIDLAAVMPSANDARTYEPIPEFPHAKRDIAFTVDRTVAHADVAEAIRKAAPELLRDAELFDVYEGSHLGEGKKSMAYHLEFGAHDRTLETSEVDKAAEAVRKALRESFGAEDR